MCGVGAGWDMVLVGLRLHLGTDVAVDPQEAMVWFGSAEGPRFVELRAVRGGTRRPSPVGRSRGWLGLGRIVRPRRIPGRMSARGLERVRVRASAKGSERRARGSG